MKKLINFWCDTELLSSLDSFVSDSKHKYTDRTQFIILAIQEKLEREEEEDNE